MSWHPVITLKECKTIILLVLISCFLLPSILGVQAGLSIVSSGAVLAEGSGLPTRKETRATSPTSTAEKQAIARPSQENSSDVFQGGGRQLSSLACSSSSSASDSVASPASFSRHIMCKAFSVPAYDPVDPTTMFRPGDVKATCLTTISVDNKTEFRWHYRSNASKTWVSCFNWSWSFPLPGMYRYAADLLIAGYWPAYHFPRAYKVDIHLDGSPIPAFSEFFEVTNGGLNSPRMCESVDLDGNPIKAKSRFTIGNDTKAHHYLRFDEVAYFNEELGCSHNFTTAWIQPNGGTYRIHSGNFTDYKDTDVTRNYFESGYTLFDFISINSSTPVGDWKVEVYLDRFLDGTWMPYGPVAVTPFTVGSERVADWTFMVYLDADNTLEKPGIDIFLKLAEVSSSSHVNIVVQMDRHPRYEAALGYDDRYGNWTDCKRFNVTQGLTPTPQNAIMNLSEVNMGDPNTLWDFVNWTVNDYPANYYFLVLWNHGTGCMGLCFDETDGSDSLSLPELSQSLDGLPAIMDVVFLDACSMAMTEVAYQLKDCANVFIGPEGLGYEPAPYDDYLTSLTSDPSILPGAFASAVVTDYISWCNSIGSIQNATMSATDLIKITRFAAVIDDFALALKENEILYHEQISLARNLTAGYPGPYAGQSGYFVDLYHFVQLTSQHVSDEEFRNTADRMTTVLESIIIIDRNKACPDSHGLSIFFPDEEAKYNYGDFADRYEEAAFPRDTLWEDFVKHHLEIQTSGCTLTIQTPYTSIPVGLDEEWYTTDTEGKLRLFVLPDSYDVRVRTPIYNATGPGSRGIFLRWDNDETNPSRTITISGSATFTAYYETQYEVTFDHSGVGIDVTETVVSINGIEYAVADLPVSFWWNLHSNHTFDFHSLLLVASNAKQYMWNSTNGLSNLQNDSINITTSGNVLGNYKTQYYLTTNGDFGTTDPSSGWHDAGSTIQITAYAPDAVDGERYVWLGWTGTGDGNYTGLDNPANLTLSSPVTQSALWQRQYLLTMGIDPTGLSPTANVSQSGPWYDDGTPVECTAQEISGYVFDHWTVDGEIPPDRDINPLTITMDEPHEVVTHYLRVFAWWENPLIVLGLAGGLFAAAIGIVWFRNRRRKLPMKTPDKPAPIAATKALPDRVATGYGDLDNILFGGIPKDYAVILTAPSSDERDFLVRRFLETGATNDEVTFYITTDPGELKSLVEEHRSNFHLFICNPQADRIIESLSNVTKIKGVENLTEINIALTKGFRGVDESITGPKRACIEILSAVLLQHHAVQTRRWLTDLLTELKASGFTTLAVLNPKMHPSEEVHAILDLFEGEINIYERAREEKFLKIKKLYNQKYLESELPLRKDRLEE